MTETPPGPEQNEGGRPEDQPVARPPKTQRGGVRGFFAHLRDLGREALSVARGAPEPAGDAEPDSADDPAEVQKVQKSDWRVNMLHAATERLRGAADNYIAAKLDEIEARVDAKLDHLEVRIDEKLREVHQQLRELRDRELRHRLRLLKLTLVFTVLVAVLSLVYKWLVQQLGS